MKRRDFLKYAACGLTAVAVGSRLNLPSMFQTEAYAQASPINLGMTIEDVEMVDENRVPHWVYTLDGQATLPGPAIFAFANEAITFHLTNSIPGQPRRFAVVGNAGGNPYALVLQSDPIPFNGTAVPFTIPAGALAPGTYLYKDPTFDPISRVLGLHGVLVVLPSPTAHNPYGVTSGNVFNLFNALGAWAGNLYDPTALFPGDPWFATTDANPAYATNRHVEGTSDFEHHEVFFHHLNSPVFERFLYRTRIWLHSSIDPVLNQEIIDGGTIPAPADFVNRFLAQYFSINGRQGVFASHAADVMPVSTVGEPHVIRMLNAGLVTHSPHPHGNHVYVISINNKLGSGGSVYFGDAPADDNVILVDTITMAPEDRIDLVLPYVRPSEIPKVLRDNTIFRPGEAANGRLLKRLEDTIPQELALVLGGVPQNPLAYPMHSHMELDQTASGGNYPQGAVVSWEIIGEFGKVFFADTAAPTPVLAGDPAPEEDHHVHSSSSSSSGPGKGKGKGGG